MNKATAHAIDLEQCALFVDSAPLKKSMTDAAAFLRSLAYEAAASGSGEPVIWQGRSEDGRKWEEVDDWAWFKARGWQVRPLYATPPAPATVEMPVSAKRLLEWADDFTEAAKKFERLEKCVLLTRAQECRDAAALASPATDVVEMDATTKIALGHFKTTTERAQRITKLEDHLRWALDNLHMIGDHSDEAEAARAALAAPATDAGPTG